MMCGAIFGLQCWSLYLSNDIVEMVKVQKRATKVMRVGCKIWLHLRFFIF